mgnify:CR=1 FL=1
MDELADRYFEVKRVLDAYTKKMKHIREKIKRALDKDVKFESPQYRIELQQKTRSSMIRKDTPSEIWQTYAKNTEYEVLHVVEKKR